MPRPVTKTWPRSPSFFIFVILNSQKLNEYDLELLPRLNNKTKVRTGDSEEVSSVSMQSQNKPCGQREQMARGQWIELGDSERWPSGWHSTMGDAYL